MSPAEMKPPHYISVAPMMDWTDRHCRFFHRLLAPDILLYTEMVTTGAALYGNSARFLDFSKEEHPVALQLGGSDPAELARVAAVATQWGYAEVNLNCGCPSPRVQKGRFGACLMGEPELVADCLSAMQEATPLPVTVKCRIAIDDADEWPFLTRFIETITARTQTRSFIVHARKALLEGLSPKENREIPPLRYDIARRVKQTYPDLTISLNGGLRTLVDIEEQPGFDGYMIGRAAYQTPQVLREMQMQYWPQTPVLSLEEVITAMAAYAATWHEQTGRHPHDITRHMLGLFRDVKGARAWRQNLSQLQTRPANDTFAYLGSVALPA